MCDAAREGMRTILLSSILILAAAAPALADVPALDVSSLPPSCRWAGDAQARGLPPAQQLASITSAASCMAIVNLRGLRIEPTQAGVQAVDNAIEPSVALYDSVIRSGDLESTLIAQQAKADLLRGAAIKVASSARAVGTMTGSDLATFRRQVEQANSLATPFRERSTVAFQQLANLSHADGVHQLAAHNRVVASVVNDPRIAPSQISQR
jgi:hypothetical protein